MDVRGCRSLGFIQDGASACVLEGIGALPVSVKDIYTTLQATGIPAPEAITHVADLCGHDAGWGLLESFSDDCGWDGGEVMDCLADLAAWSPTMANQWLSDLLVAGKLLPWNAGIGRNEDHFGMNGCHWLTSLPEGRAFEAPLVLHACVGLRALPDGLAVEGSLDLRQCRNLATLPRGLRVQGALALQGCRAWDGVIPHDAVVMGKIYTDDIHGVPLARWRDL